MSKCYQLNMNVNVVNEIMYDIFFFFFFKRWFTRWAEYDILLALRGTRVQWLNPEHQKEKN